jgi:para-aminobenzoate synthetase / 4-amino-4-deoxychorismate lyase
MYGKTDGEIILHDKAAERWLWFQLPQRVISTNRIDEILPAFRQIDTLVQNEGCHAAGFVSYEAARAFDPALGTRTPGNCPLLWFGLYQEPKEIVLPAPDFGAYTSGEASSSVQQSEYSESIARIKQYIAAGDTYQVNYTLRLRTPFAGDPWHLFLAMVRAQSPGYAAWVNAGNFSICSASPELFFHSASGRLTCKPMKGTVRRGYTLEEDQSLAEWLHYSEKNRAENLMIVDMIRNDLGRVAVTGSMQVPRLFEVEKHPTLWQMTSTVTAECRRPLSEIMAALFPCASITGAPKVRTTHIIAELESSPRGVYTGTIGYFSREVAQFNVAIRTAIVEKNAGFFEYGAGGGIVWDSVWNEEHTEALLKARILTEQLPDFSLLETILWTRTDGYFLLDPHLQRISDSAAYFDFRIDLEEIKAQLMNAARNFAGGDQKVRLLVNREGAVTIQTAPLNTTELGQSLRVGIAKIPVNSKDVFLYHKTSNRTVYESAMQTRPDCDDVLLWNERGEVTESCNANVVVEESGAFLTPPVRSGLLAGRFRAFLLSQGTIREQVIKVSDLHTYRNIYLINSVRKWRKAILAAI